MKALVFSPQALYKMTNYSVAEEWFDAFMLPPSELFLKRIAIDDIVYILDKALDDDQASVVVFNLSSDDAVFRNGLANQSILDRAVTVVKSILTTSVVIPPGWKPHREDHLLSIYAANRTIGKGERLHLDCSRGLTKSIYFLATTEDTVEFSTLNECDAVFSSALENLAAAILSPVEEIPSTSKAGIVLTQRLPQGFVQGATLDVWYKNKLTTEQRAFVDKPHDGPVRLRGAAGTGKTLSMVVKFLRDGLASEDKGERIKLGFLTHSNSSVDLVSSILEALDPRGITYGLGQHVSLEVRTIYDVAYENLRFNLDNLEPLSLDGREGRRLQSEIVSTVLKEMARSSIVAAMYADVSTGVKDGLDFIRSGAGERFVNDILNEFASVLDAEGIRLGQEKGERYVKSGSGRPAWLMPLATELDRRFILDVHRRYRKILSDMNTLSIDQMIGDFNSFLDSNRWESLRSRAGYDALYVDELHLFTSIERQTIHKLIKDRREDDDRPMRPPIFMAYDLKQSPRDSFTDYEDSSSALFTAKTGLQNSDLVQLTKVFRYTPQIAEFLADLDASFPAIDVPGEWDAYSGDAQLGDGPKPKIAVFPNDVALFQSTFDEASRAAHSVEGGGRRVAVLCINEERFDTYLKAAAGQFKNKFLAIQNRDVGSELRHAGKRFIYSMPEYVAGLQFDTVYLIHVDQADSLSDADLGSMRRFISNTYLGSSRAERTLQLASSTGRGGPSSILRMATERGSLATEAR